MNMNMAKQDSRNTDKAPEVDVSLSQLDISVNQMHTLIESLTTRLMPILNSQEREKVNKPEPITQSFASPLAAQIQESTSSLNHVAIKIEALLITLEI